MKDLKKEENKNDLIKYISSVWEKFHTYFKKRINSDQKKVALITYRMNDYISYLKQEETFNPKYRPIYKQGSIIEANLGFNIGNEYGGLHYAIVLDKKDNKRNGVLTVVPLTSVKEENRKIRRTEIYLGEEVYNLITQAGIEPSSTSLKRGSIALVNQITTISKIRIKQPTNTKSPYYDLIISEESMNKIFKKIKTIYLQ